MIQKLVRYITQEPPNALNQDEAYKFPFISSNFFCVEFMNMLKYFYEDYQLLYSLFEFIRVDTEPLPVLSGYFVKACDALILINPREFLHVFYSLKSHLWLVYHIGSCSISDFLSRILYFSSKYEDFYEYFMELIYLVIGKLSSEDALQAINAHSVLIKYLNSLNTPGLKIRLLGAGFPDGSDSRQKTAETLINGQALQLIFSNLKSANSTILKVNLKLLQTLLFKTIPLYPNSEEATLLLQFFNDNLNIIQNILQLCPGKFCEYKSISLEIIKTLCESNSQAIHDKIISLDILSCINHMLIAFPFSTILHNNFLALVNCVLGLDSETLKKYLLESVKISHFIVEQNKFPFIVMKNCKVRKGFLGHLNIIANTLSGLEGKDSYIEEILKNTEGWYLFVSCTLAKQNYIENKPLGGIIKEDSDYQLSSDDEAESDELIQTAPKLVTKDSIEDFTEVNYWKVVNSNPIIEEL